MRFNFHYKSHGYHPLVCYDGMTGDLLKIELRDGTDYSSTGVIEFLRHFRTNFWRIIRNCHYCSEATMVLQSRNCMTSAKQTVCHMSSSWKKVARCRHLFRILMNALPRQQKMTWYLMPYAMENSRIRPDHGSSPAVLYAKQKNLRINCSTCIRS